VVLGEDPYPTLRLDVNVAFGRHELPEEHVKQGRLARPVGAHDGDARLEVHAEVDRLEEQARRPRRGVGLGRFRGEAERHPVERQHRPPEGLRVGQREAERRLLHHRRRGLGVHLLQQLDTALHDRRPLGVAPELVHKLLNVRPLLHVRLVRLVLRPELVLAEAFEEGVVGAVVQEALLVEEDRVRAHPERRGE